MAPSDRDSIRTMVIDAVTMLLQNSLPSRAAELRIQGLLAVTLDPTDVFLIQIDKRSSDRRSSVAASNGPPSRTGGPPPSSGGIRRPGGPPLDGAPARKLARVGLLRRGGGMARMVGPVVRQQAREQLAHPAAGGRRVVPARGGGSSSGGGGRPINSMARHNSFNNSPQSVETVDVDEVEDHVSPAKAGRGGDADEIVSSGRRADVICLSDEEESDAETFVKPRRNSVKESTVPSANHRSRESMSASAAATVSSMNAPSMDDVVLPELHAIMQHAIDQARSANPLSFESASVYLDNASFGVGSTNRDGLGGDSTNEDGYAAAALANSDAGFMGAGGDATGFAGEDSGETGFRLGGAVKQDREEDFKPYFVSETEWAGGGEGEMGGSLGGMTDAELNSSQGYHGKMMGDASEGGRHQQQPAVSAAV